MKPSHQIKVAYQGSEGSFSHTALLRCFGNKVKVEALAQFEDVFRSVDSASVDAAVLPIENSLIGTIYRCFDNFKKFTDLHIVSDISIQIEHALIATKDASLSSIRFVYSQLPGLEQCHIFLEQHASWQIIPYKDTAAAAHHVATSSRSDYAAIANRGVAHLYNLKILADNIEDNDNNFTRFVVITQKDNVMVNTYFESSHINAGYILFTTEDKPGALLATLQYLAHHNINLHKIESRPIIGRPWEYQFVAELDCKEARRDEIFAVIKKLQNHVHTLQVLGLYNRAQAG